MNRGDNIPQKLIYSEEDLRTAKKLFDTFSDAYINAVVPFIVVNEDTVRMQLKDSRELLERLV